MAAITNGIALDGTFRSYCGTFLIFSDYPAPVAAPRGADGGFRRCSCSRTTASTWARTVPRISRSSTSTRCARSPNVHSIPARGRSSRRPRRMRGSRGTRAGPFAARALAPEVARAASAHTRSPPQDVTRGAYAVRDPANPQVVLVASGSEVPLACDAAEKLHAENVAARVVSLPCLELFYAQPEAWRNELIPTDRVPVIAIEAARGQSLRGLVGTRGFDLTGWTASARQRRTPISRSSSGSRPTACARGCSSICARPEKGRGVRAS